MSQYIDLLIQGDDLVLDAGRIPLQVDGRASIAQDIVHMIRDSGLMVTLVAERDSFRRRDCLSQMELLLEADVRLVPGTAAVTEMQGGRYVITALTVAFGPIEVAL